MRRSLKAGLLLAASLAFAGCGGGNDNAATVNGHDISMRAYNVAFNNQRVQTADAEGYDACAIKSFQAACKIIKQQALQTLINQELIREYAARHHISVPRADVDREWSIIFKQKFQGRKDVENAFLKRLHETEGDVKDGIAANLLQNKVLYAVAPHVPAHVPAIRLAEINASNKVLFMVKEELRVHRPFAAVIRDMVKNPRSQCAATRRCGELGWAPTALVPPERAALLKARAGAVVGPIVGQLTFEMYQVQAHDARYSPTPAQQYALRAQTFSRWLLQQQRKAQVKQYVAV